MIAIELQNLCKASHASPTRDHLSFQIEEGEVFGLLGLDDGGKTTLLNMVNALATPDYNTLRMPGYHLPQRIQSLLRIGKKRSAFSENLTAWDNLVLYSDLSGLPHQKKQFLILKVLTQMHLLHAAHIRVGTFSAEMKQRLALSYALLSNSPLLYLDEPTANADLQERLATWDYIRSLPTADRAVLIATRSFEEACVLCDRIALIDSGKLVALDTPEHLKQYYGDIVIELELASPLTSFIELEALSGVKRAIQRGSHISVILLDSKQVLPRVIAFVTQEHEIKGLCVRELRLDEILSSPSHNTPYKCVDNCSEKY